MLFKNILDVGETLRLEVREWRNDFSIRKHMYTDSLISLEDHKQWLTSLKNNVNTAVYVAYKNGDPIGIASINNIDFQHGSADWAFYLNPEYIKGSGLGTLLEYYFLSFIFEKYCIKKLNCEVLDINPSVIKLHKKFGFVQEGVKRANIIKNKQRVDVVLLGILESEWSERRSKFTKIIKRLEQ